MILIVNVGSSSIKFKLFDQGAEMLFQTHNRLDGIRDFIHTLKVFHSEIKKKFPGKHCDIICYRIVHGGNLDSPYEIKSSKEINSIAHLNELAPLHNPKAVAVIKFCRKLFKGSKHFAFFDTSFFKSLPDLARLLPINNWLAFKFELRKYGFHGISHEYVLSQVPGGSGKKIISIHLGAGCSLAAIDHGQPIETSMSFTPLDGLVMQSRTGAIDPGLVISLCRKLGINEAEDVLNKKSGLAGMSGTDGDMRQVLFNAGYEVTDKEFLSNPPKQPSESEQAKARFAIDKYCYEVKRYLSFYSHLLGQNITVAFTGQVGFGSKVIRDKILSGFNFDQVLVVKPDEELAIFNKISKEAR
jgi:acetate kinase